MNLIEYKPKERRKRRKKTLYAETRSAVRSLIITLSSMIVILAIGFLAITNKGAQKGYALEQAKLKNEQLQSENAILKNKIINSTTVNRIKENQKIGKMDEPEKKDYVTREDNQVR